MFFCGISVIFCCLVGIFAGARVPSIQLRKTIASYTGEPDDISPDTQESSDIPQRNLGEECDTNDECKDEYSVCTTADIKNKSSSLNICACQNGVESGSSGNKCKPTIDAEDYETSDSSEKSALFSKNLGEQCSFDNECKPAYSLCDSINKNQESINTCQCQNGFKSDIRGRCKPTGPGLCPFLEAPYKIPEIRVCEEQSVSCPEGNFCYTFGNEFNKNGDIVGRCCPNYEESDPILSKACPVGSATMPKGGKCTTGDDDEGCPDGTRCVCLRENEESSCICCPHACNTNDDESFQYDGICYDIESGNCQGVPFLNETCQWTNDKD